MIVSEHFYSVKCDNCGKVGASDEGMFWSDELGAKEEAMDSGWINGDDKDYCPDCWSYDDEDNLIIKEIIK